MVFSEMSSDGVNPKYSSVSMVPEVIGDVMTIMTVMMSNNNIKVVQYEKPGEEEPRAPEWVGNPCIEVRVVRRRWVVSDYRWPFLIIIVVDDRRVRILTVGAGLFRSRVLT
jgi:hypothetical protein